MNNASLASELARAAGVSSAVATKVLDALAPAVAGALSRGEAYVIVGGLGRFTKKHRAARTAQNPRTRETVKVAARNVVHFRPSPTLQHNI